jgi:hypothetical protein
VIAYNTIYLPSPLFSSLFGMASFGGNLIELYHMNPDNHTANPINMGLLLSPVSGDQSAQMPAPMDLNP